jgi:hypothetical protein
LKKFFSASHCLPPLPPPSFSHHVYAELLLLLILCLLLGMPLLVQLMWPQL